MELQKKDKPGMNSKDPNNSMNSLRDKRILVTGATGFVGQNLVPLFKQAGAKLILPSHKDYNLLEQMQVRHLLKETQPDIVFHLAGLIGGILANKEKPADICYQNMLMGTMMLHESWQAGVAKYITLIGGCSYPASAPSPIKESELWNGYPQVESAPYSLGKSMSVLLAQAYRKQYGFNAIVLVPGNLYGPYDNFDLHNSHVIPALIRKFVEAQQSGLAEIVAWGSGKPIRDFIYIEDACRCIMLAAQKYNDSEIVNISSGTSTSIRELVETVAELTGYQGKIVWDTTKPDGQGIKVFDTTRMREQLGFHCRTSLRKGLQNTIHWYRENYANARREVESGCG